MDYVSLLTILKGKFLDKKSIFRNFSVLMLCHLISNGIGLLTNIYIARKLQPDLFGLYGVVITWVSLLLVYSSLGIQQVVIRKVAIDQKNSTYYYNVSRIARYLGTFIVSVIFCVYVRIFTNLSTEILVIIIINLFFNITFETVQNVAFGMQRMELNGYINVMGQVLLFVSYVILPSSLINVENVLYLLLISTVLKYSAYLFLCKRDGIFKNEDKIKISSLEILRLVKESVPFYMLAIFTVFTTQFPVIYLSNYSGNHEVAYFNTANKLMVPMTITINTLLSSIYPKLAQEALCSITKLANRFKTVSYFLLLFGGYCCMSIAFFRNEFVTFLYGESYIEAADVMVYQCWYLVYNAIFYLIGYSLAAMKHDKGLAILSMCFALVNTPIFWFLSHYGAIPLSYGFVLGATINMVYHILYLNKTLSYQLTGYFIIRLFGFFISGLILSYICSSLGNLLLRVLLWLVLSISMTSYIAILWKKKAFQV